MSEQETCSDCGEPKPIKIILRPPEGRDRKLCQTCSTRWLLSEEEWPTKRLSVLKEKYLHKPL